MDTAYVMKNTHTHPNPQIALYNLVQETLQIRYLKLLVIIHVYVLYLCISTNQWIYDDIWICHTFFNWASTQYVSIGLYDS